MSHMHNGCCQSGDKNIKGTNTGCCCGGCHAAAPQEEVSVSTEELQFLQKLAQTPYLPLASFLLKSTQSNHLESVALAPVYLNSKADSMETVKNTASLLKSLHEKGLISLDYEEPLENGDYSEYTDSESYAYFKETVAEAEGKKDFLFDTPSLELGSMALTYTGQLLIDRLE